MLESDQTIDLSSERHGLSESIVRMGQLIPKACPTSVHMPRWSVKPNMFHEIGECRASSTIPIRKGVTVAMHGLPHAK